MSSLSSGSSKRSRAVAAIIVLGTLLGAVAWTVWATQYNDRTYFLPAKPPAEWVIFDRPILIPANPRLPYTTTFRRTFVWKNEGDAELRVRALGSATILLNGQRVGSLDGTNWRSVRTFAVGPMLKRGDNHLVVEVTSSIAPAALWLALEGDKELVASDAVFEASLEGSTFAPARLARARNGQIPSGEHDRPLSWDQAPNDLLAKLLDGRKLLEDHWRRIAAEIAILALALGVGQWLWSKTSFGGSAGSAGRTFGGWTGWVVLAAGAAWILLHLSNLCFLTPSAGYDVLGHLEYVHYLRTEQRLPLATDGWEMYHPPLYYLLAALLLTFARVPTMSNAAVGFLRFFAVGIWLAQIGLVAATLGRLFPDRPAAWWGGMALVVAFPPALFLSHYANNELLAATLASGAIFVWLRIHRRETQSVRADVLLGLLLGAAMLTKASSLLVIVPVLAVLLAPIATGPERGRAMARWGLVAGACLLTCGWHFFRVWWNFGDPWAVNVDVLVPSWQDPGYRTTADFLRFESGLWRPFADTFDSFFDSIYKTLWGDGNFGGSGSRHFRPPWNYDRMAIGYVLALVPTALLLFGLVAGAVRFLIRPTAEWFVLLGTAMGFLVLLWAAAIQAPYHSMLKSIYLLPAILPLAAILGLGLDVLGRWLGPARYLLHGVVALWLINGFTTYWIARGAIQTQVMRAQGQLFAGRPSEARACITPLLRREPENLTLRFYLASILEFGGLASEAREEYTQILTRDPNSAECHAALARLAAQEKRYPLARAEVQRAIELSPGELAHHRLLAEVEALDGRFAAARATLERAIGLFPYEPRLRRSLAKACRKLGDTNAAEHQQRLADALDAIGGTSEESKKPTEAL